MLIMLVILNCPNDSSPSFPPKSFSFLHLLSSLSPSSPPWPYHSHDDVDAADVIDNDDDVIDNDTAIHNADAIDDDDDDDDE